jgi:hypothetical protein
MQFYRSAAAPQQSWRLAEFMRAGSTRLCEAHLRGQYCVPLFRAKREASLKHTEALAEGHSLQYMIGRINHNFANESSV